MKKIIVTGVAGMIGSHLTKILLDEGYYVHGIDDLSVGDIANISEFQGHSNFVFNNTSLKSVDWDQSQYTKCDFFVHLAAHKKIIEEQEVIPLFETNVQESLRIVRFCAEKNIKLLFASTSDVYGYGTKIPFSENDDIQLGSSTGKRWAYAVSKLYLEHVIQGFVKEKGLTACIIRYFGGFSEHASFTWSGGHIPLFIDGILNNKLIKIHGDGQQTRSVGHADDLAHGTSLALKKISQLSGEIINIGNDEEISILDSLHIIAEILNVSKDKIKMQFIAEEEVFGSYRDIRRRKPDLTKARELLGYEPKISFEESVNRVLRLVNG